MTSVADLSDARVLGTRCEAADAWAVVRVLEGPQYVETEHASTGDSTHDGAWSIKDGLLRCTEGGTLAGSYRVEIAGDTMTFKGRTPSEDTVFKRK